MTGLVRIALDQHGVARLVVDVILQLDAGRARIELEWILPLGRQARVVPEQRPVTGLHRGLLLIQSVHHVVTMRDAVTISDDDRRAVVRLRLHKRLDGVAIVAAHGHFRHVSRAVIHGHHGQVFFGGGLAAGRELGHRAARRGFGHLAARVGVDFRIEHQDIHVAVGCQHVIQAAVADVVGPAVAADDPHALPDQRIGQAQQVAGGRRRKAIACPTQFFLQQRHAGALLEDARLGGLIGVEQRLRQLVANRPAQPRHQFARVFVLLVDRQPHAQPELRVVFK